jgi:hypothetical protein
VKHITVRVAREPRTSRWRYVILVDGRPVRAATGAKLSQVASVLLLWTEEELAAQ